MLDYITWAANPEIFSGFVTIRWYGLMFAIGFLIGYELVAKMFKHEGSRALAGILLIYVVVATMVGARLGHVFFYEWDVYRADPIRILYIWGGWPGKSRRHDSHNNSCNTVFDICHKAQSVVDIRPTCHSHCPCGRIDKDRQSVQFRDIRNRYDTAVGLHVCEVEGWHELYEGQAVHPTQLYEALCYFALFALLMWMYWKKNAEERPGLILGVFFIGIFLPRFLIEFIKNDQVAREATMTLNIGQQLSIPFILLGVGLVIYAMMRPKVHIDFPNKFADEKPVKSRR